MMGRFRPVPVFPDRQKIYTMEDMALLPLVEAAGVEPAAQERKEKPARPPSGRFHVDAAEAAPTIKKENSMKLTAAPDAPLREHPH